MKPKFPILALAGVLLLAALLLAGSAVPDVLADAAVFINEIHYDNSGTDADEAIEVAGPAGTDLTGWSLVLYNGNNGAAYNTTSLSGAIPDQENGFGTVFVTYAVNGVQNGAPDGIALVDAANVVQQFLCYEGTFAAVGGVADGMTCVDIGVAQSGSTPVGSSLQLMGTGTTYDDFTWAPEQPNTFDAVNTGQTFSGVPAAPQIVINEIIQNPDAVFDSAGEWFEVYNAGTVDVDIDGWTIKDNDTDSHVIANGGPLLVLAGDFLVLGINADSATNGGAPVDYQYSGISLANGADEVVLLDVGLIEIDRVEYDGGPAFPDPTGASMSLIDPALDNNVGANWCEASTPYGDGDLGTPGSANDCTSGELPNIVINEIIQNPDAVFDSAGEWFEVYNAGTVDVDIDGWTIKDNDTDSHVIANGGPLLVLAGDFLVLGINADSATNGGAPVDYQYSGISLANGADEVVLLDVGLIEIDRVEYDGGPAFPDPTGASMSLIDPALDNNVGANWCEASTPYGDGDLGTPGTENDCDGGSVEPLEAFIHEVQGSGSSVAITDLVIVEAIVVADYQLDPQLDGFFIQEEDADADADDSTSEGIFVYCFPCATDVAVGDKVQVTGLPGENYGMSQISVTGPDGLVTLEGTDALPTPSTVNLPAGDSTVAELTFENVEGMLVTFPDTLVVSEYFQLARFGQLVLTVDERVHQFTDANAPSEADYSDFLNDLSTRRIILDDDTNWQNPSLGSPDTPYYWPRPGLSNSNLIRGGDSIAGLTGAMHWSWAGSGGTDAWRIRPVNEAFTYDFTSNISRPAAPDDVDGSLKVASFNVLNYFTTIDDGPDICGPNGDLDCRGAHSTDELTRQRDKIVNAMITMDADVIGLMELENNASAAIQDLVDGLNAVAGTGTYDFINTGTIGSDAIKVGFIFRTTTAAPVGDFAILDSSVDPTFNDDKNRPTLAQTFEEIATGAELTVAVNHLKSKGSNCDSLGDPDLDDGQANCNLTRTSAATALANWLATDPTNSGDPDFMIIGDLNSYRMEDPIDALKTGGYTDLLDALIGPDAYTYLFDGQLGYLDYAMSNGNLSGQVTGVTAWNINADEIPLFDYNDEIQDPGEASFERESSALPIFEPNASRASDHDPVLVGLDLNGPPVCSAAAPSIDTLWSPNHEFVLIDISGITDPDGDFISIVVDSIFQDEEVVARGDGSGKTSPDGQGIGTSTAEVRAERNGNGNGRYYHISFTADDGNNNSCSGVVKVSVPKSQGIDGAAVDDGALFDSTESP